MAPFINVSETEMSTDELFDHIIAGVKSEATFTQRILQSLENWPMKRDEAYKNYADALGKPPLTDNERKQAWLNYVLKESE